jgi:hypothetical protein
VAVFIIESRLAVVWLRSREAAEQIVGPHNQSGVWIVPRSRMTFRFSTLQVTSSGGYPPQQGEQSTSIVEVTKAVADDNSIDLLRDWQMLLQPIAQYCDPRDISVTGCRVLIRFSSIELAKRSAWQLNDYLLNFSNNSMMGGFGNKPSSSGSSSFMVRILPVNELKVVSTVVQGPVSLFEIVKQIQQVHNCSLLQYLEDFLRKATSSASSIRTPLHANDAPIVLSLSYVSAPVASKNTGSMHMSQSMEEQVYFVCPSVQDSRSIEMQGILQLLPQSRLCIVSTVAPQIQEMRPQFSINNTNNFSQYNGNPMANNASNNRSMYPSMGSQAGNARAMGGGLVALGPNNMNYQTNRNRGNMGMMNTHPAGNIQGNMNNMNMMPKPFILW